MAADRDSARLAGPLLAAGRVQDALRVVSWDVDPGRRGVCPCGRTFILNGFKTRCHICRDQCGHVDVLVGFKTSSSGHHSPTKVCTACGYMFDLPAQTPLGEFCFKDNRRVYGTHPCARCGATEGTEQHHWAPVAIFGYSEAEQWPKAWLCPMCHSRWHRMMRRAKGWKLTESEIAGELTDYARQRGPADQQSHEAGVDLRAVLALWPDIMTAVRTRSRTIEVMLESAQAHAVGGQTIVIRVQAGAIADRLGEDRNTAVIEDALAEILGGTWAVRWDLDVRFTPEANQSTS